MTFLSVIGRFATLSALFLGAVALSGCPGGGGDSSDILLTQQAYLKASNTGPGDLFSTTIAFDGDTLVVGAPFEDSSLVGNPADNTASGSGAVYVFTKSGGVWSQQAYLKASNIGAGDNFGTSVALDGDTLVVGSPLESSNATGVNGNQADNSANGSGAVYVFTRSAGVWSQQAYLKASNAEAGDNFGTNVALDGDTLVVGSPFESSNATGVNGNQADNSASGSGAVYVFTRSAGVWSQQAYVKASNTEAGDQFGKSVALSSETLVVGASGEDSALTGVTANSPNEAATGNGAGNSGAVYVFTRSAGVWSQQAYLKASNAQIGDDFGGSVALSSDTLVVGASLEDSNATGVNGDQSSNSASGSGAAYVFTRSAGVWSQQAYLKASNSEAGDNFGASVALDSDTVVIGAFNEDSNGIGANLNQADNSASGSGAAYVFTRSAGVWTPEVYVKASNSEAGDQFGYRVAVSAGQIAVGANVEGSALTGVTNGSPNEAATGNGASISGAVYLFAPQ
ncbi:MAG: FG-GAP repeat protein [Nitrospira sp.]|nr:FG-GAP repeat protein [Nitrospira sp.]